MLDEVPKGDGDGDTMKAILAAGNVIMAQP